ncbi:MAG: RNA polymerase sigma factor [Myxococcaceae bacterium]
MLAAAQDPRSAHLERALARLAAGDSDAFNEVVAATADRMYRLAARLTGDPHEAEDVLQEGYARAYDAVRTGHFDGRASVQTWLYRIITNSALDSIRSRRRRDRAPAPATEERHDGVRQMDSTVALRELAQWMDELPTEQRAVLVLKELEGLTSARVAEVLGISEGAVEQRLVRARVTLRERSERD